MPAALIAHQLTVVRGPRTIVADVDLHLAPGRRVGLVGPNGVGKSTLLRALAGRSFDEETIEGSVEAAPPSATVGMLPQEPERAVHESVDAFLARRTGVDAAQRELDDATERLARGATGADDAYSRALDRWTALGAADVDARTGRVFAELSIDERIRSQYMPTLSGGEAARVSLASVLLSRFDVMLLDEPTNDLDLDGLERLERWLVGLDAAVALVSHDRAFLERTITDVVEIDHHTHRATWFAGGWTAFLEERQRAGERAQARFDEYDGKRRTLLARRQREREWAARGAARVRRSDETDKHIRHHQLNQTEQLAGRSARTDRAIDRLDVVDEQRAPWELRYDIPTVGRSGDIVATANDAVIERPGFRLGPVQLDIAWGERVAITGPNGSGKTTLLELLLGRIEPTSGRVGLGSGVVIGEIEQARASMAGPDSLVEVVGAAAAMEAVDVRTLLAKFGLVAAHLDRPASSLSPGERTRAALAALMANGANLLVLDEPTNHLDLPAIEQLEGALERFGGTMLLVSHDRALLERVRVDRSISVDGGVVADASSSIDPTDRGRRRR